MKPLTLIALGACVMFILIGVGSCRLLWGLGEAAGSPKIVKVELPGLMKKTP